MTIAKIIRPLFFTLLCLTAASTWSAEAPASTQVNINTADAAMLADALNGVGEAKAAAIVAWREQHGPFKAAAQLTEVRGIGDALVEANRDRITVQ